MDSKFKLFIGLLVSSTLIYFYFNATPVKQNTPLSLQNNESVEVKHPTVSKHAKNTDLTNTASHELPIKEQVGNNISVVDSLDKIPECHLDPSNPALVEFQQEIEQAKTNLISQWQHLKNTQTVTLKQQVNHILFGIEQTSDIPTQLDVLKQYLTNNPSDNVTLTAATTLCGNVTASNAVCDDFMTSAVSRQKNGRILLALANSKLKQEKFDEAETLMRQATQQPIFQDTFMAYERKAYEFYASNTNFPANKLMFMLEDNVLKGSTLFALYSACSSEDTEIKTPSLCHDVGLQLYQSGSLKIDKMIGHSLLKKYYENHEMVNHLEDLAVQYSELMVKTKSLHNVLVHVMFEERMIPTYLSEAYDNSEQARVTALAEQLLDYYQDPNYTPCQKFNL